MPGRFSIQDEITNIRDGMHQDLQMPAGQTVRWWQWDDTASTIDEIYDTGYSTGDQSNGRMWKRPIDIPCLTAFLYQGQTHHDERGFYNIDRLHMTIDMKVVWRLMPALPENADAHLRDRIEFRGAIYQPYQIWQRGQVKYDYTVLSVDATQVKPDEMVNDPQFSAPEPSFVVDPAADLDAETPTYNQP